VRRETLLADEAARDAALHEHFGVVIEPDEGDRQ
jgi:hypothetical protein